MIKLYLSGPMTGKPDNNYPVFNAVAAELRGLGFAVENPAEHDLPPDASWGQLMRQALTRMLSCDAVVFLPGWSASKGAAIEQQLCVDLDIRGWAIDQVRRDPQHVFYSLTHNRSRRTDERTDY